MRSWFPGAVAVLAVAVLEVYCGTDGRVRHHAGTDAGDGGHAHGFGSRVGSELGNVGDAAVEGTVIPEVLFGTADAAVAGLDGDRKPRCSTG